MGNIISMVQCIWIQFMYNAMKLFYIFTSLRDPACDFFKIGAKIGEDQFISLRIGFNFLDGWCRFERSGRHSRYVVKLLKKVISIFADYANIEVWPQLKVFANIFPFSITRYFAGSSINIKT